MVEYNKIKINVRLSDSQLNKLKTATKNQAEVTVRINIKISKCMKIIYHMIYY